MKVLFKTNIDAYKTSCFPDNLTFPPRIGEKVMVSEVFNKHYENKKLPTRLQVVDVIWSEKNVICELWYNETDKKIADMAGAKTL